MTVPNGYGWFELEQLLWWKLRLGTLLFRSGFCHLVEKTKTRWLGPEAVLAGPPSTLSDSPHVQRFTLRGVRRRLEQAGFTVERTAPRGNLAHVTGTGVAQWMMRALASRELKPDGNFTMSRWRAPLVMPFMALAQLLFAAAGRWLKDDTVATLGFAAVARRPDRPVPPARA